MHVWFRVCKSVLRHINNGRVKTNLPDQTQGFNFSCGGAIIRWFSSVWAWKLASICLSKTSCSPNKHQKAWLGPLSNSQLNEWCTPNIALSCYFRYQTRVVSKRCNLPCWQFSLTANVAMWSPEGVEKEKSATRAGKCSIFILTLYLPAGIYICQCPRILLSVNVNMLSAKWPTSINIELLMWVEFQVDVSLIINWIPRIVSRKTLLKNEAKESTYRNGPTDRSLLFIICETFLDDTNMSFFKLLSGT